MMQVNGRLSNNNQQTSFKGSAGMATKFLTHIDFSERNTSQRAVMVLYSACIASRIANSRDKCELRETSLRDSIGWTSLFFVAPICQQFFGYSLEKLSMKFNPHRKNSTSNHTLFMNTENGKLPSFFKVINPFGEHKIKSFKDIEHIPAKTEQLQKLKNSITRNKCISYLLGLGVAISVLGIGIPRLNVIMTRKQFKSDKSKVPENQGPSVKNSNNLNMNGFLDLSKAQKKS